MPVSQGDREYMRRLGAYKQSSHEEAGAAHRALPLAARLRRSWQLSFTRRAAARESTRDDDPGRFYDLARSRGLYCP